MSGNSLPPHTLKENPQRSLGLSQTSYDTQLLLAEAREWRQRAETANPVIRDIYCTLATEAEARVALSLYLPVVKENAVPEDDVEVDEFIERTTTQLLPTVEERLQPATAPLETGV